MGSIALRSLLALAALVGIAGCTAIFGIDQALPVDVEPAPTATPALPEAGVDASPSVPPAPPCTKDLTQDPANCGACGHDCRGGSCVAGACQPLILYNGYRHVSRLRGLADGRLVFSRALDQQEAPYVLYPGANQYVPQEGFFLIERDGGKPRLIAKVSRRFAFFRDVSIPWTADDSAVYYLTPRVTTPFGTEQRVMRAPFQVGATPTQFATTATAEYTALARDPSDGAIVFGTGDVPGLVRVRPDTGEVGRQCTSCPSTVRTNSSKEPDAFLSDIRYTATGEMILEYSVQSPPDTSADRVFFFAHAYPAGCRELSCAHALGVPSDSTLWVAADGTETFGISYDSLSPRGSIGLYDRTLDGRLQLQNQAALALPISGPAQVPRTIAGSFGILYSNGRGVEWLPRKGPSRVLDSYPYGGGVGMVVEQTDTIAWSRGGNVYRVAR